MNIYPEQAPVESLGKRGEAREENVCVVVSGTHWGWRLQYLQSSTFLPQAEWREEVKKHFEKIKSEGACIHRLDEELIRRRREELRSAPALPTESHFSLAVLLGSLNPPTSHRVPLQSRCLPGEPAKTGLTAAGARGASYRLGGCAESGAGEAG